jgi:hypothetical protein
MTRKPKFYWFRWGNPPEILHPQYPLRLFLRFGEVAWRRHTTPSPYCRSQSPSVVQLVDALGLSL